MVQPKQAHPQQVRLTFLVSAIAIAAADRVLGIKYHEEHAAKAGA